MPRGGKRKGAGRRSTWKSGCKFEDTKLIRVPEAIAEQVLQVAHQIDSGESLIIDTKSNTPSQLSFLDSLSEDAVLPDLCLSGVDLGRRLGISSAALTPKVKEGPDALAQYTKKRDPNGIAWKREGKKYKPVIASSTSNDVLL